MTTKQTYTEGCVCKCALMRACTRKFVCENNESPRPRLQLLVSEREKKSIPRAPRVWLGAMNQGVHGYRPPLSDINHLEQNASSSYSQKQVRTRLAPSPVVFAAFLSGRIPDKQMHPLRQWDERGRGRVVKSPEPRRGPRPGRPVRPSACWACAFAGAHLMS